MDSTRYLQLSITHRNNVFYYSIREVESMPSPYRFLRLIGISKTSELSKQEGSASTLEILAGAIERNVEQKRPDALTIQPFSRFSRKDQQYIAAYVGSRFPDLLLAPSTVSGNYHYELSDKPRPAREYNLHLR